MMLTDKQLDRYADVLLWGLETSRKRRFKKNDVVGIFFQLPAVGLAERLYDRIMQRGLHPVIRLNPTSVMEKSFFTHSNEKQLGFKVPGNQELYGRLNGSVFLHAPESITHLRDIDPKKIGKAAVAKKYLRDILDKREEQGLFGWTLCTLTTRELAEKAKLTMKEYSRQIVKACFLDRKNPVDQWKEVYQNAQTIKNWLNKMDIVSYHIESENMDLKITQGEKRKWIGVSGHNIPSFELFLSPDRRYTSGCYFSNQPSYRSGNYVKDVMLEFKNGSVSDMTAKVGKDFVKKQLSMDKGADKIGEFSLTDKRFSRIDRFMANTLYDENYGGKEGNCHIALGASYSDTYDGDPSKLTKDIKKKLGFNDSALHWDLVNTEKKIVTAVLKSGKKKVIYEKGMFLY